MGKKNGSKIRDVNMKVLRLLKGKDMKTKLKIEKNRTVGVISILGKIDGSQRRCVGHLKRMDVRRVTR